MKLSSYLNQIINSASLEDKLLNPSVIKIFDYHKLGQLNKVLEPRRPLNCKFSNVQYKFPKTSSFHKKEKRAEALHFFANHELLAIEIMASALLNFDLPNSNREKIVKGILGTIFDEQKHFKLYQNKMAEYKIDFGEIPVNDYFWRQFLKTNSFLEYFAIMALTFEAANLDFCHHYMNIFKKIGDESISNVLKTVFEDEISHVQLGAYWLDQYRGDQSLWDFYCKLLPGEVTPSRGKGINYNEDFRLKAGIGKDFARKLSNYKDSFKIVERKSNK